MPVIRHRSPVAVDGDESRGDSGGDRQGSPGSGRRRRRSLWRRFGRSALLVAAGTAALALAGPFALRPFTDVAGAAGRVTVACVIDFGGSMTNQVVGCVSVPASSSKYDALSAFVAQSHLALPTYASSGLLCSINTIPASGCGQVTGGGYVYWSYFTGAESGWTYASTGAFGTVTPGDVEGWRFQDPGTGHPNDPAPRTTSSFSALCPSSAPPPTTTTTPTTKVNRPPTRVGGKTGGAAGSAGAVGAVTRHVRARRSAKATTASPATGTSGGSTSTTLPPTTPSTYPAEPGSSSSASDISIPDNPLVRQSATSTRTVGGIGPDPLIVGGLIVAALVIAATGLWRRRSRTP